MSDEPEVTLRENGPLVIANARSMKDRNGAEIQTKDVMALCRCGASKNKPFCDGSHNEIGFKSDDAPRDAGSDREFRYKGSGATIAYNPRVCSHAGHCARTSRAAFDPDRKPWVKPDEADVDTLESAVRACPSGALRIAFGKEELAEHRIPDRPTVEIEKNGPYYMTGVLMDHQEAGVGATKAKYVLCRCGLSGNKPFCDGTHFDEKWSDGEG